MTRFLLLLTLWSLSLNASASIERPPECNSLPRIWHAAGVVQLDVFRMQVALRAEAASTSGHAFEYQSLLDDLSALETATRDMQSFLRPWSQVCAADELLPGLWVTAKFHMDDMIARRKTVFDGVRGVYGEFEAQPNTPVDDGWTLLRSSFDSLYKSFYKFTPKPDDGGGGGRDDY